MKLSEAIRLGSMLGPQARGSLREQIAVFVEGVEPVVDGDIEHGDWVAFSEKAGR